MEYKSKSLIHNLYTLILSFYLSFIFYLGPFILSINDYEISIWKNLSVFFVLVVIFYLLLILLSKKLNYVELRFSEANRNLLLYFILGFLPTFIIYLSIWLINYPGSLNIDSVYQLEQVINFSFNDWHPYLHTLTLWAFYQIHNSYAFLVFSQLLIFSLACGYLSLSLAKLGFAFWSILLSLIFIVLNPQNQQLFMFALKDVHVSVLMLFLVSIMINVIFSDGLWLKKNCNKFFYIICVTLITLYRHNSIFLTIPILVIPIFLFQKARKNFLITSGFCFVLIFYLKFVLPNQINVTIYHEQKYSESLGLPMTTILNVKKLSPHKLDIKTNEFLSLLGTDEHILQHYILGNFNSLKWVSPYDSAIEKTDLKFVSKMFLTTIRNAPLESIQAVAQLTRKVWDIRGQPNILPGAYFDKNNLGLQQSNRFLQVRERFKSMQDCLYLNANHILNLGFFILVLNLSVYFSYPRRGYKIFWFAISVFLYNFGTMLLLSGEELRYFNFNFLVTIPICLTAFMKRELYGNSN